MSDPAAVDHLFDGIDALDVLINNAGIARPTGQIDVLEVEDIRRILDVDVMGQFLTIRRAAPLLRASGSGAIITISSVAGRLGYAMRTPYAVAKWGIVGLTASLAKEVGLDGIRVKRSCRARCVGLAWMGSSATAPRRWASALRKWRPGTCPTSRFGGWSARRTWQG